MVQIGDVTYEPFNYANVLQGVEDIKGARTNRRIRENAMKRQDDNRAMKEAKRARGGGNSGNDLLGIRG